MLETTRTGALIVAAAAVTAGAALLRPAAAPPPPPPEPEVYCVLRAAPPVGPDRCDRPIDPFPTGVRPADFDAPPHPGLAVKVIDHPCGGTPPDGDDSLEVRFAGWNMRGEEIIGVTTLKLTPAMLIPGFAQVVKGMSVGDRVRTWIPGELAYDHAADPKLRGMLTFEIELLSIDRQ